MAGRKVEVAYVTKFSGPIRVWRDAEASAQGYLYLRGELCRRDEWTESRATAEARWRAKHRAQLAGVRKQAEVLERALERGPDWEES